jgi:hypothetical protein
MANIIGSGLDALRSWISQCEAVGGTPLVKTRYGRKQLTNSVIVVCWEHGNEVHGGEIVNIPAELVQRLSQVKGKYKLLSSLLAEGF